MSAPHTGAICLQYSLQVEMGFNKKLGKYNANRLYLAELEVSENDIYLLEKLDQENAKNIDKSEGMKIIQELNNKNIDTTRH